MAIRVSKNRITLENIPINESKGANVASGTTVDLTNTTGNFIHITGTTTITAITLPSGFERTVVFDGILILTHNATTLILPGEADITTAVGDTATFRGDGTGNTRCVSYTSISGSTGGGGHTIVDSANTSMDQRANLKFNTGMSVTDDDGNDTTIVALNTKQSFTAVGFGVEYDNGSSGSSKTIDWNNGQNQKITLTDNCTFTLTPISIANITYRVQITLYQNATGGWNVILPSNVNVFDFDFTEGTANQYSTMTLYYNGTFWTAMCTEWSDIPS